MSLTKQNAPTIPNAVVSKVINKDMTPIRACPAWHGAILNDREAALNAGKVTVSNREEAKERIKKNVA